MHIATATETDGKLTVLKSHAPFIDWSKSTAIKKKTQTARNNHAGVRLKF